MAHERSSTEFIRPWPGGIYRHDPMSPRSKWQTSRRRNGKNGLTTGQGESGVFCLLPKAALRLTTRVSTCLFLLTLANGVLCAHGMQNTERGVMQCTSASGMHFEDRFVWSGRRSGSPPSWEVTGLKSGFGYPGCKRRRGSWENRIPGAGVQESLGVIRGLGRGLDWGRRP